MSLRSFFLAAAALAAAVGTVGLGPQPAAADEQFIPMLIYRTGPYAPNGTPLADGQENYYDLVNKRDGGVNGVKIVYQECETEYNNDKGVECYERLKENASVISPFSTGITYALIEKARADKIPILSMGYGRADATIGSVFPHVFTLPVTYWAQADALVQYAKAQEGGSLKGKKIALVYHDSAYGKEPIATLQKLAEIEGYQLDLFAVAPPGVEQKPTWLQIGRQLKPDWVFMWGWGVMNSTAIKEAAAVGFPMDHFIGVWWSGSEQDVMPAGADAKGYKAGAFNAPGTSAKVFQSLKDNLGTVPETYGTVLYNRGLINAAIIVEAIRTAQAHFGNRTMTGEEMIWGFQNLDLTAERIEQMGMTGLIEPLKVTCNDHEGGGKVLIQQWDGEKWTQISDWITPNRDLIRPMYEASAEAYAKEKGITPATCP
jgi:branched-chain amino acid transport system substrate-binding protein